MTLILRPAADRGHADHSWLNSYHSFSFADYYDPAHMGYRSLRVINDDIIQPSTGFPMHGHRNMEIITYGIDGGVAHRDSSGGAGITRRGDVQVMTAGRGIMHSEFNASDKDPLRLLQIWLLPDQEGLAPSYAQATIPDDEKRNTLALIVGPKGGDGGLSVHQNVCLFASLLQAGKTVSHELKPSHGVWLQVADGTISVNGTAMIRGDGALIEAVPTIHIIAEQDAEFLLFDFA